jgi:predicted nucleotidyltransferase
MSNSVEKIYTLVQKLAVEAFADRLLAVYLIGSLSHGGFAVNTSDIDVAFIIDGEVAQSDWDTFDTIDKKVKDSGLELAERISIFWSTPSVLSTHVTSGAFPAPSYEDGLFPPFDVLDLLQNGKLIYGRDVREMFLAPTQDDLYIAGVEFLLSYVREQTTAYLKNMESYIRSSPQKISKTILFPIRLLYTLETGKVGNNNEAAEFISRNPVISQDIKEVVKMAMALRNGDLVDTSRLKDSHDIVLKIYSNLLDLNNEKMKELNRESFRNELSEWRGELKSII